MFKAPEQKLEKKGLYQGQRVLVIGLGLSGRSAVQFLLERGAVVHGVDKNVETLLSQGVLKDLCHKGLTVAHEQVAIDFNLFHLVVVSPGILPTHQLYQKAKESGIEMIGEVELACRTIKQPFLGITGTNGKTTVTLLVTHVLKAAGKKAVALGNVGKPLAAELLQIDPEAIVVAELSSYQLDTLQSLIIDAGVILNVTPDHLDRYGTMENYAKSKFHLKDCLKSGGKLFVEERTFQEYLELSQGREIVTYGYSPSCELFCDLHAVYGSGRFEYALAGNLQGKRSHDVENQMAAFALCRAMGVTGEQFSEALKSFKKPSHRIEFVMEKRGVAYYDDSKGTNLDAVIRAVEAFQGNIILIAGGVDKGASYRPWIQAFGNKVKAICAIGQAAEKMKKELEPEFKVDLRSSLEDAVRYASSIARKGDTVLLSPGCSSFDMFKDYAHRGEEFQRIVRELI